jgi:hypothetical protein
MVRGANPRSRVSFAGIAFPRSVPNIGPGSGGRSIAADHPRNAARNEAVRRAIGFKAFAAPIESGAAAPVFVLTRFTDANRCPLRWKTLKKATVSGRAVRSSRQSPQRR